MSDEDYISRVLEGHEETTGRWMNARSSQRRSSHHRNEQGRRRPAIQDQWGRTRRRGSNRNRGAPPRGGRTRRGVLAVDEREQNDSDVDFWCRQCGQWLPRRDQQVHARLHFQAMLQGGGEDVFSNGAVTFMDPLQQTIELKTLSTAIKAQILTTYGPGRLYSCCYDILRETLMSRAMREVHDLLVEWKEQQNQDEDIHFWWKKIETSPTHIAALSWICIDNEIPSRIYFSLRELHSTGHIGAFLVSIMLVLNTLVEGASQNRVEKLEIFIPKFMAASFMAPLRQGLVHIQALFSRLAQKPVLKHILIRTGGVDQSTEQSYSWVNEEIRHLENETKKILNLAKEDLDACKLAFIMGQHHRLGAASMVQLLPDGIMRYIIQLCGSRKGSNIEFEIT